MFSEYISKKVRKWESQNVLVSCEGLMFWLPEREPCIITSCIMFTLSPGERDIVQCYRRCLQHQRLFCYSVILTGAWIYIYCMHTSLISNSLKTLKKIIFQVWNNQITKHLYLKLHNFQIILKLSKWFPCAFLVILVQLKFVQYISRYLMILWLISLIQVAEISKCVNILS